MHDICIVFGAALCKARHALGLTQIELAERLGTTDRSISDLERGKTNPKLDTMHKTPVILPKIEHIFSRTFPHGLARSQYQ